MNETRLSPNPYRLTVNIKAGLFVLAIVIVFGVLLYTQYVVEKLRDDSRHIVKIYTQLIARIGQDDPNGEYSFTFDEIIKRIDFPIVNTDAEGTPLSCRNISGIPNDSLVMDAIPELKEIIKDMDIKNPPLPIMYETSILGYIHYDTDTKLIRQLAWLPYIEITVVGAFILIGYIGFSNIRRSEQRSIWIGMAKETAHQLGTPISSLLGWVELLKQENSARENAMKILSEMEEDLKRLDRVTSRFSQIGSLSDLKPMAIQSLLHETAEYFRKRLPQLSKRIVIEENYHSNAMPFVNAQLITWVIENLLKNAVDAIEQEEGTIVISLDRHGKNTIIDVSDTGRGVDTKHFKDVFRPGFSTKKRGWGLGLSLAKRIIEDYHGGKIFVKESELGRGTTIRIQLRSE